MLRAVRIALADGTVVTASAQERPELFQAARVGLGALGVLLELTLQCVPAFTISASEHSEPLEQTIESFVQRSRAEDHLEFF